MKPLPLRLTGIVSCLLAFQFIAIAQSYMPDSLIIHAKAFYDVTRNTVVIRWVPADYETWKWGNEHGYRLERRTVKKGGGELPVGEQLNSKVVLAEALFPLSESEWEPMSENDEMAGVAAGLIHGDSLEIINYDSLSFTDVANLNAERENRYGFSLFAADNSLPVAIGMGLGFEDNTVDENNEYFYSIEFSGEPLAPEIVLKKGKVSILIEHDTPPLPPPANLEVMPGDKTVVLTWDKKELDEHYTSYCVEKSEDGGASFQPAHDLPLVFSTSFDANPEFMQFYDSLEQNATLYVYRVKGKTPFGIMGPYSDTIQVYGIHSPLNANVVIKQVKDAPTDGHLKVTWDFPANMQSQISGFDICRAKTADGNFVKLNTNPLPVAAREFIDVNPEIVNYYKVQARDLNDYVLSSNAILGQPKDTIPPIAPTGLLGICDKSGRVTIRWAKNTEDDLMGYRVFMSNNPVADFAQVTGAYVTDTAFQYTINLNTLSDSIFFAVKALDFRQNTSALSASCTVIRPDIIPPAPPSITNVTAEPNKVHFTWAYSSSNDVVLYQFQRKVNGKPGWATILSFDPGSHILNFTDTTASYKSWWDYRLLAKDEADNVASSKVVKAKPVDNGIRDSVQNFTGQLLQIPHSLVLLQWDYMKDPDLIGFQIYRGIDTSQMRSYKFLTVQQAKSGWIDVGGNPGLQYGFVDNDLDFQIPKQTIYTMANLGTNTGGNPSSGNNVYSINPNQTTLVNHHILHYQVMAKFANGASSPLTHVVVIQL